MRLDRNRSCERCAQYGQFPAGALWCITNDNKLWRRAAVESKINWDLVSTGPTDHTLAITGTTFLLYAIDSSGQLWMAPARTPILWSPVPDMQAVREPGVKCMAAYEDTLFAATENGELLRTGTDFVYESLTWARVHHCNSATGLAVVDTMIFVTTTDEKLWWLDLQTCALRDSRKGHWRRLSTKAEAEADGLKLCSQWIHRQ